MGKPGVSLRAVLIGTLAPALDGWWHDLIANGSRRSGRVDVLRGDPKRWDEWPNISPCKPLMSRFAESRETLLEERDDSGLSRIGRGGCGRGDLPVHLLDIEGHRKNERASRRVLVNVASALVRFEAALPGATAHALKGAAVGTRHPALVQAMARWGGRQTWNGRPIDADWLAGRCAAYWLGMPDRRTFGEVEAAGILAWVLSARRLWLARAHRPEFIDKQRERGRMGKGRTFDGKARASLLDTMPNEAARPWEAAGVHRATWYRRRARAGRATNANGSPAGS